MKRFISICIFMLFVTSIVSSQSRATLEKERNAIINRIESTAKEIKKNKSSKSSALKELKTVERQIENRQKLIQNINHQLEDADQSISRNKAAVDSLNRDLQSIKDSYREILRINYLKDLSESKWIYILSAATLNESFLRWRYRRQFENYLDNKIHQVNKVATDIELKNDEILHEKEYISTLLADEKENYKALENDQRVKNKIVKKLSKKERALNNTLATQKKEREKLNQAIERIILSELSKSKPATEKAKTKSYSSSIKKRALRWPVDGKIVSRFGKQPHPTIRSLEITNNGVDIRSSGSNKVLAVAKGKVLGVTQIPGYDYMVIIQHGEYYSVYSKLTSATVQQNQDVTAGQSIGLISNDKDGELHFELWKNKVKLDPELWLAK